MADRTSRISRRLMLAEALDRGLELGLRLAGRRFRTLEELEGMDDRRLAAAVPERDRGSRLVLAEGALWEPGDRSSPRLAVPLSAVEEQVARACDGGRSLAEISVELAGQGDGPLDPAVRAAFLRLVAAGFLTPGALSVED